MYAPPNGRWCLRMSALLRVRFCHSEQTESLIFFDGVRDVQRVVFDPASVPTQYTVLETYSVRTLHSGALTPSAHFLGTLQLAGLDGPVILQACDHAMTVNLC